MSDPKLELREVTDGLRTLSRRMQLREQQLADAARQLRRTSRQATFEAPAGDRSRQFVEAQARRLDTLARRLADLRLRLLGITGELRPTLEWTPYPGVAKPSFRPGPGPHLLLDWDAVHVGVQEVIARCPPPDRPGWEATGPDDDPETGLRPVSRPRPPFHNAHGPAWFKPLPPVRPLGRTWRLDLTAIKAMTKQLRLQGDRIAEIGTACRREFDDPSGRMPEHLRQAIERAGVSASRISSDIDRRLHRHAVAIDKRMATPGLLGPGPEYGLSAFGIDRKHIALDLDTEPAFAALAAAGTEWHDRARELTAIMEWLCRRLPVVFGTPADAFFELVGVTDTSPPPDRPPGRLPPQRYPVPPELEDPETVVVDPSTSVSMTKEEYYGRYGVPFGAKLPQPLLPLAPEKIEEERGDAGALVDDLLVGAAAGAVTAAVVRERDAARQRRSAREMPADGADADGSRSSRDEDELPAQPTQRVPDNADDERLTRSAPRGEGPATSAVPVPAADGVGSEVGPGPDPGMSETDPQLAHDAGIAIRRGGVRLGPGAGAVLGSVVAGGAAAGAAVTKRNAAKKITNWMQYKAKHRTTPAKADV